MLVRLLILGMLYTLGACQSRKSGQGGEDIADFSLSSSPVGTKVDDREYFNDLQRSESMIGFESSFPLPLSVGKATDPYDRPPEMAKAQAEGQLSFQLGSCRFSLRTGPLQVDRYLLAGQWIKLTEGLPAGVPVKLEPHMDLNIKIITQLLIEVPESQKAGCRRLLEGKRVVLGRFHLNKSRIGLVSTPSTPRVLFSSRSMEPKGKLVSLRWPMGSSTPSLLDDLDFPATCESGIFRALMGAKGFYYLNFQPVLRMDQYDQMVIRIPYPASVVRKPEKGPAEKAGDKTPDKSTGKVPVKPVDKSVDKPVSKASEKSIMKAAEKAAEKPKTTDKIPSKDKGPAKTVKKPDEKKGAP